MTKLLRRVRRRLRLAWAATMAQTLAPAIGLVAIFLLLASRFTVLAWAGWAAAGIAAGAAVGLILVAVARPIPELVCARAADRGLATDDAFATALETAGSNAPLVQRVQARAEVLAGHATAAQAVPVRVHGRRLAASSALAACCLVLVVLPNPNDAVQARRAAERALVTAEGRKLEQTAKALDATPAAAARHNQIAAQLADLGRQLQHSPDLTKASHALNRVAAALTSQLSPNSLSEKAAALGLDRSLADRPLPGAGAGSAAQQLAAAAAHLDQLDATAKAALSERLQALAATQTAGDPKAATDLAAAAGALASGNGGAAVAGLQSAAADQTAASADAADQASTANALAALADSQSRLAAGRSTAGQSAQGAGQGQGQGAGQGAGQGQGQGQGQGAGQGQGQGAGQGAGQGQGQGQGSGQGRGAGQGQGAGSPSGQVGGTGAATANGGQGGLASPNGSGHNASVGLQEAKVYDPVNPAGGGPQLNAGGPDNGGPSQVVGRASGPNVVTGPATPLAKVLPRYQAQATQALDTLDLPPSLRALVQSYFQGLANGG